jgi:hypothetical protein
MPTSTYTIGPGGDYETFNALNAAQSANTDDIICNFLAGTLTSASLSWINPAFNSITIRPLNDAQRNGGIKVASGGVTAHTLAFTSVAGKSVSVDGLYCQANLSAVYASGSASVTFQRCVHQAGSIVCNNTGTGTITAAIRNMANYAGLCSCANTNASGTLNLTAQNITIANGASTGVLLTRTNGTLSATIENVLSFGHATASFNYGSGTTVTANNNASSDATADDAGGSGHLTGITAADCVVGTTTNFSPKPGGPLIGAGKTIAEIVSDIIGTTRPQHGAYDIGAFEFVYGYGPGRASPGTDRRRRKNFALRRR